MKKQKQTDNYPGRHLKPKAEEKMNDKYKALREELTAYYETANDRAEAFCQRLLPMMDAEYEPGMSACRMKALQYRMISEEITPVLFAENPFYYETGTMGAHCDGARDFRGTRHAGGWTHWRNAHLFIDAGSALADLRHRQGREQLYLICGVYADTNQHFCFNYKPLYKSGLRGLYEKALAQLDGADETERDYLTATAEGLLALRRICDKFASAALSRLNAGANGREREYLLRIADSAAHAPWEAPRTFYEALNMMALLRVAVGALEGVGFNTFGRPDADLLPFYEADIVAGRLTKEEAYDLITRFLLTFDCHYDHDMKMVGYADHELENTYTLGGCDAEGKPVWNDLTEMFLRATREEKIIFPKITCRFSSDSPKDYLDAANLDVINGTSSILYQNDETTVAAFEHYGRTPEEARDYLVTGCWGTLSHGCDKPDGGSYVNILRPFELSVHGLTERIAATGINFETLDGSEDFEGIYAKLIGNCRKLFAARSDIMLKGKGTWSKVDPLPIFSAPLESCLDKRRDYTAGGCKYNDNEFLLVGFPNIIDSLLAIKKLCFEDKRCTFAELLGAVRNNWQGEGAEELRIAATHSPCWGDGNEECRELASRFDDDLYALVCEQVPTIWGGRTQMGHLTYTEIRFWGEKTLATPDGRHSGDYICQGLTPSRLHEIKSVTSVINSLACLDGKRMAGNSVVNIILPPAEGGRMTLDACEAFLRAAAKTALMSLQLNCVSREQLLAAQKKPKEWRHLIVRVCGFSARFTSLSPEWQQEVLTRNFYE
ncbi:MAG: hypothetical protein GX628_03270 [Clostridiales bacterium]|nr:hypothetical protein [Clostridiales bacterium]